MGHDTCGAVLDVDLEEPPAGAPMRLSLFSGLETDRLEGELVVGEACPACSSASRSFPETS